MVLCVYKMFSPQNKRTIVRCLNAQPVRKCFLDRKCFTGSYEITGILFLARSLHWHPHATVLYSSGFRLL